MRSYAPYVLVPVLASLAASQQSPDYNVLWSTLPGANPTARPETFSSWTGDPSPSTLPFSSGSGAITGEIPSEVQSEIPASLSSYLSTATNIPAEASSIFAATTSVSQPTVAVPTILVSSAEPVEPSATIANTNPVTGEATLLPGTTGVVQPSQQAPTTMFTSRIGEPAPVTSAVGTGSTAPRVGTIGFGTTSAAGAQATPSTGGADERKLPGNEMIGLVLGAAVGMMMF